MNRSLHLCSVQKYGPLQNQACIDNTEVDQAVSQTRSGQSLLILGLGGMTQADEHSAGEHFLQSKRHFAPVHFPLSKAPSHCSWASLVLIPIPTLLFLFPLTVSPLSGTMSKLLKYAGLFSAAASLVLPTALAATTSMHARANTDAQYKGLNVTVDDTYGDFINNVVPEFQPSDLWVQGSDCWQCALRPNLAWTIGGTWKDTTYYGGPEGRNITFKFAGASLVLTFTFSFFVFLRAYMSC